jgi:hypothetical protein
LEQRTKDSKSKQGPKTSIFHLAIATVTQAAKLLRKAHWAFRNLRLPCPITSLSKKMFDSLKETLQALNINQENRPTSGKEVNEGSVIEPSADMLPATDKTGSQINVSVSHAAPVAPFVDQTLQSSEEAFFEIETIDQV